MLAHFLSFVTPERMHKTRFSSLLAATQSLLQHQRCTVTAIGRSLLTQGNFGNNQMLVANPEAKEMKRFLVGPVGCEITGITTTPDQKTMFVNIQHPREGSTIDHFLSHWPDGGNKRPRPAILVITKDDGGQIGE